LRSAKPLLDRQQTDFTDPSTCGQVGIQIGQLLIERKGAIPADGKHPDQFLPAPAN